MRLHHVGILPGSLVGSLLAHHSLQQLLSVLVFESVLLVLVAQSVAEGERILQHFILRAFELDLSLDKNLQQLKLVVQTVELSNVGVTEVVGLQVQSRTA